MTKGGCFRIEKLNLKSSIMFSTSTTVNATLLYTTGVLQFISLPQMKRKSNTTSVIPYHNHYHYNKYHIISLIVADVTQTSSNIEQN
jgi:hypothetical protein